MSNSKTFTAQIFKWMAQVNRDKILPSAKNIAMALAPYFNEEEEGGAAWPSLDKLAGDAGMSKANVIKLVPMLEARGHLKVRWGSQGSGNSNYYWMQKRSPQSDLSDAQKRSPQSDLSEQEKGHSGARKRSLQSEKRSLASDLNLLKPSKEPSKQQPRAREEKSTKESSSKSANGGAQGEGVVEGKHHPYGRLLAKLLEAAGDNVERDANGIVAYGIDSVEPILDLIRVDRCSLEADVLPAVAHVVPPLTEPLPTWADRRIRDACIARRRTREAATTQQQRRS